jgi:hypothetical protein
MPSISSRQLIKELTYLDICQAKPPLNCKRAYLSHHLPGRTSSQLKKSLPVSASAKQNPRSQLEKSFPASTSARQNLLSTKEELTSLSICQGEAALNYVWKSIPASTSARQSLLSTKEESTCLNICRAEPALNY